MAVVHGGVTTERHTGSARVAAPLAAILLPGGFFGVAHVAALRALLYAGAALVAYATVTAGVGLLRSLRRPPAPAPIAARGPAPA